MNNLFNVFNALGTITNATNTAVSTSSNLVQDVNKFHHFKNTAESIFSKDDGVKKLANDRLKCNSEINWRMSKMMLIYFIIPFLTLIIILVTVQNCPDEINIQFGKYNKIDLKILKNLLLFVSGFMPFICIFGFFKMWPESVKTQAASLKINKSDPIDTNNCIKYLDINT